MTNDKKKVAVVIISYNGKELLTKFLPPILADSYDDFEVYVIDNASTDSTSEFLASEFPQVKVIPIKENHGFTNGYVEGLQYVDHEYYILISSDVEVTPNWISPVIKLMESDRMIAACQPKMKNYNNKSHFEYAGASGGYIDNLGYPFCRGRMFFTIEEDKGQYDDIRETFWATGGCLFIRSELYHKAGGLDNDFYAHMEEIDLCWRLKNMGYKIMACPQSVVYHVGGHIINYGSPAKIYRNFRNSLIMNVKNMKAAELMWKLPMRLLLDVIYAIKVLLAGNFMEFRSIAKAHLHFFAKLPKWFGKRRKARKLAIAPNLNGIYKGSIVFDYFLRKKKRFSDLNFRN